MADRHHYYCSNNKSFLRISYMNKRQVVYLKCYSEDKDSEDDCSIGPVPKNLHLIKTDEQV